MSNAFDTLNCDAVLNRFNVYLTEAKASIQDAFEFVLQDAIDEGLAEDEMEYVVEALLIPETICRFADHYTNINNCYDGNPDPSSVFRTFCTFEKINEDLADTIADVINKAVAHDHEESDDDDANVVFNGERDWQTLSPEERQQKVKAFLKKIAHTGLDAANLKPFIRNIGNQENRSGPPNESIHFPSHGGVAHDELHRGHILHKTLLKHGYAYSHTIPVTKGNGVHHYHVWQHSSASHQIGSYEGSSEFSSKVSPVSGHVFIGIGTKALDKHLTARAKRYRIQNNECSLPNTKLMESLLDPA